VRADERHHSVGFRSLVAATALVGCVPPHCENVRTEGGFDSRAFSHTYILRGLNYKVLGADGTGVSARRYAQSFPVFFDENGNIVDFTFENSQTSHLLHFYGSGTEAAICEALAQ
jgi:hypothetical protein